MFKQFSPPHHNTFQSTFPQLRDFRNLGCQKYRHQSYTNLFGRSKKYQLHLKSWYYTIKYLKFKTSLRTVRVGSDTIFFVFIRYLQRDGVKLLSKQGYVQHDPLSLPHDSNLHIN
jgi:hypothetical protein